MHQRSFLLTFFLFLLYACPVFSQGGKFTHIDSIRHWLDTTHSTPDKIHQLIELARITFERGKGDEYANQAIELAQLSRDQRLIATTYLHNGQRFLGNSALSENLALSMKNLHQAEAVAKENGFEDLLVQVYCGYALVNHNQGNDARALSYATQAMAIATSIDNDTAKVAAYCETGEIYMYMNQMLLSLRNYLNGLDVAEKSGKPDLLRISYSYLRYFYSTIGEYDKAIDYELKSYDQDRMMWNDDMTSDLEHLGDLFLKKDQPDLALKMYEESIHVADTFRFDILKINAYHKIFLLYLQTQQYKKGLQFLFAHQEMLDILHELGFDFYLGQLLATNYMQQGRYDSALYYFRKAEPEAAAKGVPENQCDFYMDFGEYYKKTKNLYQAITYYNKAYVLAASVNSLSQEEKSTDSLETLYVAAGKYPEALVCEQRGTVERDSLRAQTQTTDLMKLEVENDGRRRERLAEEDRARTEHRHNIQYMGFTMGLVILFVGLVMLGRLSVPVSLIRALVFVAFIFLFEFIIMLADKQIQGWTEEEPWKVLLLKIVLAAGMVPLHHWLEHKVVHYLSHHKRGVKVSGGEVHAEVVTAGGERL